MYESVLQAFVQLSTVCGHTESTELSNKLCNWCKYKAIPIRLVVKRAKCGKIRVGRSTQNVWKIILFPAQVSEFSIVDEYYYFLKCHKITVDRARLTSDRLGVA